MKALLVSEYGPPQNARIGEVDRPLPADGELLVQIKAAGINPYDVKLIQGAFKETRPLKLPFVPGSDGSGVVVELGKGVANWRVGDTVLGMFKTGTLAGFAVVSATGKRLARKPDGLDFEHAAVIPQSGLTARTVLRAAALQPGQTVFVNGATGGVGLYVTQLAKAQGARVIATGTSSDREYLQSLGAEDVVDYKRADAVDQVKQRYPQGVDAVVELIGTGDALLRTAGVLRSGGKLVSTLFGPDNSAFPPGVEVHYIQMKAQDGDLDDLAARAATGTLKVEVDRVYPFDEAAQALTDLLNPAKHTRGKLVVAGAEGATS